VGLVAVALALNVPFVSQRAETCGPASLAMVLAYWGENVTHDELADAVMVSGDTGVQGTKLVALAESRGFRALAFEGDLPLLRDYLSRKWPLVVALEAGRGRFHDVVVVGLDGDSVIVHDPAEGPARKIRKGPFERKWLRSGRWTLLVLPGESR